MSVLENIFSFFGLTLTSGNVVNCSFSAMELLGWCTACISLTGAFLNARKRWYSFLVWMVANISWIMYDIYNGCYAQAALFMAYLAMNMYGLYCWKLKKEDESKLDDYIGDTL